MADQKTYHEEKTMSELNKEQQKRLKELEAIIDKGMESWQEVAKALAEVKEQRLYIGTHEDFSEYALDRFGLSEEYANCYVRAGRVLMILGDASGVGRLRESHCRELSKAGDADNIRKLWDACKKLRKLTAKVIAKKRDDIFFEVEIVDGESPDESKAAPDPWQQLKEDYRRLVKLPKNAPELLAALRSRGEVGLEAVLSLPVGSQHYVLLRQGDSYFVWRYLWNYADSNAKYQRHRITTDPVPLTDALNILQGYMPEVAVPEAEDQDDEYIEEAAA